MDLDNNVDILEDEIVTYGAELLSILLKDRTTGKNIIWATNDYSDLGELYLSTCEIELNAISGRNTKIIQPRITKHETQQASRTREKAEVFTPSWICNEQNNLVDEQWFGRADVFNIQGQQTWTATTEKIEFPNIKNKTWKNYVDANRMEITCGEAPYLVSRYDTVTGIPIELQSRIGLLDRKLRVVNENTYTEKDWLKWTQRAFQSTYGYEYQGDNLLLARENLLYTFIDNMKFKWSRKPTLQEMKSIATIVSWNIWQMDGINYTVPLRAIGERVVQLSLFEDIAETIESINQSYCKIKDWRSKKIIEYITLVEGEV
ncbi:MAG: restriction endonuclease subunit M [Anaerovoracaceae bacterium]